MAENFYYGAEEQGVFVDKEKAKYYYDLAGEEMPEEEDDDDELGDICTATFNIDGDETQIEQVAELIENLTAQYGTPDNEFGLYLPIRHLIEKITGSVAYEGNIISCKKNNQEGLEVMVETNSNGAYALKYALRIAFPGIEVTNDYSIS